MLQKVSYYIIIIHSNADPANAILLKIKTYKEKHIKNVHNYAIVYRLTTGKPTPLERRGKLSASIPFHLII